MVIDVKVGSGAFMRNEARAESLAHALVSTGNSCGIRTRALLTDMNQPLGRAVGNAIEVRECLDLLRGDVDEATRPVLDLSVALSAHMLVLSGLESSLTSAHSRLQRALDSGAALECFRRNVEAQGGEPRVCDEPERFLPLAAQSVKVESARPGFITRVNATEVGHAIAAIGGGRVRIEDSIDASVGFMTEAKIGDEVGRSRSIGLVLCSDAAKGREAAARIQAAYEVGDEPLAETPKLIKEVINE
jgi:thymidine phosphorylase